MFVLITEGLESCGDRVLITFNDIETILYFHIALREAFDLLITTQGMLYPGCSSVTSAMIDFARDKIKNISDLDLLNMSDFWQARIQKRHQKDV